MEVAIWIAVWFVATVILVLFGRFLKDLDDRQKSMMSDKDMEEQQEIHKGDC